MDRSVKHKIEKGRGKMANKRPTTLQQAVAVPAIMQTGFVAAINATHCEVQVDRDQAVQNFPVQETWVLKWKDRTINGSFLYIAKAWRGWNGNRILRVQKHLIYKGAIRRRIIILERVNGQVTYEA